MDRIYVAIDVETTGLEAGVDEIIEVAAVKFRAGEVLETFQQLVRPRHSLPLKVTQLTGITADMLEDAPRFPAVAPELARFLKSYPLVGHSVEFDLRMLQAQNMRLPQPAYDTFELAVLLMPKAPAYRLGALTAALGIPHDDAHRALSDAHAARQVFLHLLGRIEALSLQELDEIIRLAQRIEWPMRDLFEETQRAKARLVFVEEGRKTEDRGPRTEGDGRLSPQSSVLSPLKPTGDERPIDIDAVRRFFTPDGPLGRSFPGYEQREQQVAMAQSVAAAINNGDTLMVEAGTGTGKGMAYLVPAAMFAAQRGQRVVISTNTINLQDQLFFKDIPALQRIMAGDSQGEPGSPLESPPFTAALLKGRGNYLCLKRYKELKRDTRLLSDEVRALMKVQLWLPTTTSGDKAELMLLEREAAAWGRMSAAFEACPGPKCADFNDCFFFKARKQAEAAHLVVVNHALMLADLVVENDVIPRYDYLVIDEAHNLEDVATDQFSFNVDQDGLIAFLDDLHQQGGREIVSGLLAELPARFRESGASQGDMDRAAAIAEALRPAVQQARDSVYDCFNRLTAFVQQEAEASQYDSRLRITPAIRRHEAWAAVERAWENLSLQLTAIGEGLGRLDTLLGSLKDAGIEEYDMLLLRVQALKRFATEVRIKIGHIIVGGEEQLVTWITQDRKEQTLTLSAAPLSVAELLRANLFEQKAAAVLTSATLSVAGGFDYVRERIGLSEPEELHLDSPFDYEHQALVYIPNDVPEPGQQHAYQRMVEEAVVELARASGGRMLALFTANNALRQTYRAIQEPLEDAGIAVLAQGIDGSRRALLERFKEFPRTVLLGTTSFWEGVDVVGDALSVLVIAKLPFSVPNDPVFAARSEGLADSFNEYAVPQAILRFKQGFGRLIRSREDRGVVAVLDKRLITKRYGQLFLDSLPPAMVRAGALKRLPELTARFLAARL
ncbi:MAG TPA: helicase C-terminal domain-containing protein [Roseiflexaceae bacterium]|nr:helicase C-terminal domain-containing protein [Roseiflexaceae bacterium]